MSEHQPISNADLARYWGCSPANVSNLVKRKAMPAFTSLRAADEWRAVNAPLRKTRQTPVNSPVVSSKNPAEPCQKNVGSSGTTTPQETPPAAREPEQLQLPRAESGSGRPGNVDAPEPERIDVSKFIDHGADFIELQIRNAKELSQITYGLLKLRTQAGEPGAIAAASKNWHETSKAAADIIEKFIAIQTAAGVLIRLDDVENVIATELEEIRKQLKRLGKRAAAAANPTDPSLAERAIDGAVDQLLATYNNLIDRARLELADTSEGDEPIAVAS